MKRLIVKAREKPAGNRFGETSRGGDAPPGHGYVFESGKIAPMANKAKKRFWLIRGYDSLKPIFEKKVKLGEFTDKQIKRLLQTLAAREGLTLDEIVEAFTRRKTKMANSLLEVHHDYPSFMCGQNPYFIATIVDENGRAVHKPGWYEKGT